MVFDFKNFASCSLFFLLGYRCIVSKDVEDVELPNSCIAIEVNLDEILSTLGGESPIPCS
jgi:hypothetical protein